MAYKIENNEVYFNDKLLLKADVATFEVFLQKTIPATYEWAEDRLLHYARDHKQVYLNGKIINQAVPENFEVFHFPFAKDKHRVYKLDRVQEWDAATFQVLSEKVRYIPTWEDDGSIWIRWRYFLKDKFRVATDKFFNDDLYKNELCVLLDADPATFEVVKVFYAKDKHHVYHWDKKLTEFDTASFEVLNFTYLKDKFKVYQTHPKFRLMENADPSTFHLLMQDFTKDAQRVFFRGRQVTEADATTFEVVERKAKGVSKKMLQESIHLPQYIAKDQNHLYTKDMRVPFDVDTATFELLNDYYAKDQYSAYHVCANYDETQKTAYYWKVEKIEGADAATFKRISLAYRHKRYAKDKNHVYLHGEIISPKDYPKP